MMTTPHNDATGWAAPQGQPTYAWQSQQGQVQPQHVDLSRLPPPTGPAYGTASAAAAAAPTQAPQTYRTPDGRPTAMSLTVPGIAATQVGLYDMDKARPYLMIDGRRWGRTINGNFMVPMADGRREKLTVRSRVPGFPKVSLRGTVLYASPKPPASLVTAYVLATLTGGLIGAPVGGIGLVIGAYFLGSGAAVWVGRSEQRGKALATVIVPCALVLALAVGLVVAAVLSS